MCHALMLISGIGVVAVHRATTHRHAAALCRAVAFALVLTARAGADPIRFVFTGHINPLVNIDRLFELADLIAEEHPRFVVIGGDVIVGPDRLKTFRPSALEEQWAKFDLFVKRVGRPVYLVPGNHDVSSSFPSLRGRVRQAIPDRWRVPRQVDIGDVRLVLLGTVDQHSGELRLPDADLAFLTRALADAGGRRVLIFAHHWLWESHDWWTRVRPVLGHGAERWVFAGDHTHAAATDDGNVHLYGCGCGPDALNYLVVDVTQDAVNVTLRGAPKPTLQPIVVTAPPFRTWFVDMCRYNLKLFAATVAGAAMACGIAVGFLFGGRRRRAGGRGIRGGGHPQPGPCGTR